MVPEGVPRKKKREGKAEKCKKCENPPKKHKNALFSLGSLRNNFIFTYSEPARRDDFGKVRHLYGIFFLSWVLLRHHVVAGVVDAVIPVPLLLFS